MTKKTPDTAPAAPKTLTAEELAARLGIGLDTLEHISKRKGFPTTLADSDGLYLEADIDKLFPR